MLLRILEFTDTNYDIIFSYKMRMDMDFATFSHMHITLKKCGLKKFSVVINIIITLKLALLDKLNLLLILSVLRFKITSNSEDGELFCTTPPQFA